MRFELARPRVLSADGLVGLIALTLAASGAYLLLTNVGTEAGLTGWTLLAVGVMLYVPRLFLRLELTPEAVEVGVVTGQRTFPCDQLADARVVEGRLAVRWLGVGAARYHTGYFHLTGQGRVKAYTSTWSGPFVLLERQDGVPLVVSPADPEAFIEAYRDHRRGR